MVWQSACLAAAFLAPALAGWRFYSTAAEDDGGGAPDPVGRLLFTSAFALSALLLELLLAEVAGLLDAGLRAAAWAADVRCLLFLLLVALPYTALYRALAARPRGTLAGAASGAAAALVVALAAFWHLSAAWPGVPRGGRGADGSSLSTLARAIARVGAAGAAVVGALSGYGAVALPRANLVAFVRPVTTADVASAEAVLVRTVELAARKRKQAALAARAHAQRGGGGGGGTNGSSSAAAPPQSSFFSSLFSSNRSASASAAAAVELTADAAALDALARELAADALDLRAEAARARAAATFGGKVRNCLGYALSLYCVLRVFGAAKELAFPSSSSSSSSAASSSAVSTSTTIDGRSGGKAAGGTTTDPFARALGALLAAAAERAGAPRGALSSADASHYVSVAAVGLIGVGSLRAFMRACRKALSSAAAGAGKGASGGSWRGSSSSSGSSGPSSSISASAPLAAALALSEVLGLYALSTTLLTSRRLPLEASAAVDAALGGHLDAGPFHRAFNATFLLAAAATVAVDAVRRALADNPPGVSGGMR